MKWQVLIRKKAEQQSLKLPRSVLVALGALILSISKAGPVRGDWPNYSKLTSNIHHCHLKKGRPTYVAVWTVNKKTITVELVYAGTHEKAPY